MFWVRFDDSEGNANSNIFSRDCNTSSDSSLSDITASFEDLALDLDLDLDRGDKLFGLVEVLDA